MTQIAFMFSAHNIQTLNDKLNEGWKVVSSLTYVSDKKHSHIICVLEKEEQLKDLKV